MNVRNIKATILILAVSVSFAACKKDYTCTCTSTNAFGGTSTEVYELNNQNLRDADDACENFESDNAFVTRNCNL